MKQKVNRLWIRTCLLYGLSFFLIFESAVAGILWMQYARNEERYEQNLQSYADTVYNALQAAFDNLTQTGGSIFSARWYTRYRSYSGLYDDEFTLFRRIEITTDLLTKTYAFEFLHDLLVITPSRDSVISKNGWFTLDSYAFFYSDVNITLPDTTQQSARVSPASDNIAIITLEDATARYDKTVVCLLLDRSRFARYMERFAGEDIAYARIALRDEPLYEQGTPKEGQFTVQRRLTVNGEMLLAWPSYAEATMPQQLRTLAMLSLIALLGAALLALALSYRSISPLSRLIRRVGLKEEQSLPRTYALLDSYIETVSDHNMRLQRENHTLNSTIERFSAAQDSELLFQMLTNPDFDLQNGFVQDSMPWISQGLPYLLLFITPDPGTVIDRQSPAWQALHEGAAYHKVISLFQSEYYVALWYADAEKALQHKRRLARMVAESTAFTASLSEIQTDTGDIAATLISLKEEHGERNPEIITVPVLMQIQLITSILGRDLQQCHALLAEARSTCSARAMLRFLADVANEYGIDVDDLQTLFTYHRAQGNGAEKWNTLTLMVNQIAEQAHTVKDADSEETASIIRTFVDENYADHNLSIRMLSDHFQMGESVISKLFKEKNGISFSKHLQTLRINRAKTLLETESMSVAAIGEMVGFISYLTFKRTFLRVEGITPVEYRALFRGQPMRDDEE